TQKRPRHTPHKIDPNTFVSPNPIWIFATDSTPRQHAPAVSTSFLDARKPLNRFAPACAGYSASANAARADISGRNSCCGLRQSLGGLSCRSGSSVFLRVRTPDGAADILPAGPRRQENRKSKTRAPKSPCAKRPAARVVAPAPAFCSAPLPGASDESWLATSSRPRKCCRRRATRSDLAAAL